MPLTQRLHRLRAFILLLLLSTSTFAATTVYKVKNPDGSVSYSDQPNNEAEVLQVEPVPTVPSVPVDRSGYNTPTQDVKTAATYRSFSILSPTQDQAFQSPEGSIEIRLALEPALQESHTLDYWLDGSLYQSTSSLALQLNNLDRGTHVLEVKIIDKAGQVIDSRNSSFTIHRPFIKPKKDNTVNKNKPIKTNP